MMHRLAIVLAVVLASTTGTSLAHHKPGHHIPPGLLKKQLPPAAERPNRPDEHVCLVTTAFPDDPYAEVVATEWLPWKEAQEVAEEDGAFIILHPDVNDSRSCADFLWEE